jgi:hypothetical protein
MMMMILRMHDPCMQPRRGLRAVVQLAISHGVLKARQRRWHTIRGVQRRGGELQWRDNKKEEAERVVCLWRQRKALRRQTDLVAGTAATTILGFGPTEPVLLWPAGSEQLCSTTILGFLEKILGTLGDAQL